MARLRGMRGFSRKSEDGSVCGEWGCEVGWKGWVRSSGIYVLSIFFLVLVSVLVDPAFFFLFFWFLNLYDTSLWLLSTFAIT